MKKDKTLIQSFYNFLEDPEGISEKDMIEELHEYGVDVDKLEKKVIEIVKKGSQMRRLAWRKKAQERRAEIEEMFEDRKSVSKDDNLERKIKNILAGNFGPDALSFAEAYFRKIDSLTEKDMESLIEDLEDLNLLKETEGEED